jgi:myo-inositol 2-dehydrogenase/D-chiro-inositol 1-dehydrogenase
MVKIGVVGCGKIAEKHLNAYKKFEDIEVAVTDIVEKGKMIAKHYGVNWHDNPDNLILGNSVDAIDVCIPTPLHGEVILKAMDAGKHVFCEKPLTKNLDEAIQIQEKAIQTNRVVMVGYLYRFHPAFQLGKDIIREGVIGKPYYGLFRLGGRGSHKAWKHKRETGGGAKNEMLVHMLDLILWYFGETKSIKTFYVDTILKEREIEGKVVKINAEDLILLNIEMANGVKVLCESDLITPSYMSYLEVHGTNGSFWTSILDYFPTIVYCKEPRGVYDRGHNFFKFSQVDLFEKELRNFIESIENGKKPTLNSVEDSIKINKIIESAMTVKQRN